MRMKEAPLLHASPVSGPPAARRSASVEKEPLCVYNYTREDSLPSQGERSMSPTDGLPSIRPRVDNKCLLS